MARQGSRLYKLTLGKNLLDRKNNEFLIAICPNCGKEFDIKRNHYKQYLAKHCPHCNVLIHYNK